MAKLEFEKVQGHAYGPEAETLTYSSYSIIEDVPSKFIEELILRVETGFSCPRCDDKLKTMEHAEIRQCRKCGLMMQLYGNALYVWD